jgi:hypothetical protein
MDIPTLLASAGISAVVGTMVSLVAISQVTVGKMRAERAEEARREIRAFLRKVIRDVANYQAGHAEHMQRDPSRGHIQDAEDAAVILSSAQDLRWWPRQVVRLRTRRIYGREFAALAERYPSPEARTMGALLGPMIKRQLQAPSGGKAVTMLDGLLHRALSSSPNASQVRRLRVELHLLSMCGWI